MSMQIFALNCGKKEILLSSTEPEYPTSNVYTDVCHSDVQGITSK